MKKTLDLFKKYPPSSPCGCGVCLSYCLRPGWWTVSQAEKVLAAGYGSRMMLEVSPDRTLGVLSPAFRGCEGGFALQEYSKKGCTFLKELRCELHGSDLMPLECRFCHHERVGQGERCHADLERDWNSSAGRALVAKWCCQTGLYDLLPAYGLLKLVQIG